MTPIRRALTNAVIALETKALLARLSIADRGSATEYAEDAQLLRQHLKLIAHDATEDYADDLAGDEIGSRVIDIGSMHA